MTIRSKIAIVFTTITTIIMVALSFFVFTSVSEIRKKQFQERVKERAKITAMAYLEEDELSASIFENLKKQYFQVLPHEKEWIGEYCALDSQPFDSILLRDFNIAFLNEIYKNNHAEFHKNNTFYSGIFYPDNQGDYIIIVSATDIHGLSREKASFKIIIIELLISLFFVYFFSWYFSKKLLQPLTDIINRLKFISASNLSERLPNVEGNKNEIAQLSININSLLDRLETAFELQSNFISNASHELNNPLTAIIGESEVVLSKDRSEETYKQSLLKVSEEAYRLQELIFSLFRLAQARAGKEGFVIEDIVLEELILDVIEEVKTARKNAHIDFKSETANSIISGSYDLLKIAFQNIVENACKFSSDYPVMIRLFKNNKGYGIEVTDEGTGIPEEDVANIFEPFYRANNVRMFEGSGIGLSLVKHIIDFHKGNIIVSPGKVKGTVIRIELIDK